MFSTSLIKSIKALQFIYSDIWGAAPLDSVDGFKYISYLLIIIPNTFGYIHLNKNPR